MAPKAKAAPKYPKGLGPCIDMLYKLREVRLVAQRALKAREEEEDALETHILESFTKDKVEGAKGEVAQASRLPWERPIIADWDKFIAHVMKTKQFDLLQKQVPKRAVEERWAAGKAVPGLDKIGGVKLSLTKVTKRKVK